MKISAKKMIVIELKESEATALKMALEVFFDSLDESEQNGCCARVSQNLIDELAMHE